MRYLSVLLATLLFSVPALGGQCPTLMKQVDAQMESADLDASTRAEVEKLRAQGYFSGLLMYRVFLSRVLISNN